MVGLPKHIRSEIELVEADERHEELTVCFGLCQLLCNTRQSRFTRRVVITNKQVHHSNRIGNVGQPIHDRVLSANVGLFRKIGLIPCTQIDLFLAASVRGIHLRAFEHFENKRAT